MKTEAFDTDVLVIGGGNAALCAALMAREAGARVLLLESAPREWRGGNSGHTRNLRCMHDAPQDVLVEAYPEEEYWQDLLKVTGGKGLTIGPTLLGASASAHILTPSASMRRILNQTAIAVASAEARRATVVQK